MTEKQFTLEETDWSYRIRDNGAIMKIPKIVDLLNELSEEREQLKQEVESIHSKNKILLEHCDDLQERNDRQAETIREIYNLIGNNDWETLTAMVEELNKAEKQLKIEMECYE